MQHLEANSDTQHPGYKHIPRLLDHFYHDGLNGRSLFLVLERLGPNIHFVIHEASTDWRLDLSLSRQISRQLILAVDYLHNRGIVHGDIHVGNILFCISDILQLESDSFEPDAYKVTKYNGGPIDQGVPTHYVDSMWYYQNVCEKLTEVKLVDFSSAFFISDPPANSETICTQLPPEILFKKPLSKAIDIWGLACTTNKLVTSQEIFNLIMSDNRCLVPQYYRAIGEASASWLLVHLINAVSDGVWKDWPDSERFFYVYPDMPSLEQIMLDDFSREGDDPSEREVAKEKFEILGRYLRKMLIIDAKDRPDTKELLKDEWVQEQQDE